MHRTLVTLAVLAWIALPAPLVAQNGVLAPDENLITDGLPPLPASLTDEVRQYSEARTAVLLDWHPVGREILMSTRFGEANQLHNVGAPGGARRQLTFFSDRIAGGSYQPTQGDYLLFRKDVGGNEFYQTYRLDLASGDVTLLTDGTSRNGAPVWNRAGDRVAYTSTRRTGADSRVTNPHGRHGRARICSGRSS
jgi:Tol biopolymer transport system component